MSFLDSRTTAPADSGAPVIPSDTDVMPRLSRFIYVGAQGNLAVVMADGSKVIFTNVPSGTVLHIRVSQVMATGTSAGSIVALW